MQSILTELEIYSPARDPKLSVSVGIYFCTGERLLDAGVRFSYSSWKRLNVSALSLLGGELSKQANSKHPPGPLAKSPLRDWSKVIGEAFVESFPGPCFPPPSPPTHPTPFLPQCMRPKCRFSCGDPGEAA